jgi:hypothetical protein
MDPEALKYLYIHANSLAELGLASVAREIDARAAECTDVLSSLGGDEREYLALERLSSMDMSSMMNGFVWETFEHDAAVCSALSELQAQESGNDHPAEESCAAIPDRGVPAMVGEMPSCLLDSAARDRLDLDVYLSNAYSALANLPSFSEEKMAQLDMAILEAIQANIPKYLTPLTGALSADELKQWLDCYLAGNNALDDLVTLICGLTPAEAGCLV